MRLPIALTVLVAVLAGTALADGAGGSVFEPPVDKTARLRLPEVQADSCFNCHGIELIYDWWLEIDWNPQPCCAWLGRVDPG